MFSTVNKWFFIICFCISILGGGIRFRGRNLNALLRFFFSTSTRRFPFLSFSLFLVVNWKILLFNL